MRIPMLNLARIATFAAITVLAAASAAAQTAVPDFRGTWKGDSHTIALGGAHPHHPGTQANEPRFDSTAFTLTVDKQDGRRFFGTFSSARGNEAVIGVMARNGTIFVVHEDGYTI